MFTLNCIDLIFLDYLGNAIRKEKKYEHSATDIDKVTSIEEINCLYY
jgi:hypothetical protein